MVPEMCYYVVNVIQGEVRQRIRYSIVDTRMRMSK